MEQKIECESTDLPKIEMTKAVRIHHAHVKTLHILSYKILEQYMTTI